MRPEIVALSLTLIGAGMIVGGVYILAGTGWAMLAGAAPFFLLAAVIRRGLNGN